MAATPRARVCRGNCRSLLQGFIGAWGVGSGWQVSLGGSTGADRIPKGSVDIKRGQSVLAAVDGHWCVAAG